jgi:hypothetical protein
MIICQYQPRKNFCPEQKMHVESRTRINSNPSFPAISLLHVLETLHVNPAYGSGGPTLMR